MGNDSHALEHAEAGLPLRRGAVAVLRPVHERPVAERHGAGAAAHQPGSLAPGQEEAIPQRRPLQGLEQPGGLAAGDVEQVGPLHLFDVVLVLGVAALEAHEGDRPSAQTERGRPDRGEDLPVDVGHGGGELTAADQTDPRVRQRVFDRTDLSCSFALPRCGPEIRGQAF